MCLRASDFEGVEEPPCVPSGEPMHLWRPEGDEYLEGRGRSRLPLRALRLTLLARPAKLFELGLLGKYLISSLLGAHVGRTLFVSVNSGRSIGDARQASFYKQNTGQEDRYERFETREWYQCIIKQKQRQSVLQSWRY